jgi:hypothetical protein
MAPTNKELRTLLRPPPMKLLPRHCPDWRVQGASPTRAAICRVERTEFRQFGDQGPGDCLSDAGHGSEEILFLDPDGRSAYLIVDQDVQLREFFLQRLA